jgi:hypothetical protein
MTPQAALERLADALDPGDFVTTLTTGSGRAPRLTVTRRHTRIGEDIYADEEFFWWSRAEPIATIGHPAAAAGKVTSVLQAAPHTAAAHE